MKLFVAPSVFCLVRRGGHAGKFFTNRQPRVRRGPNLMYQKTTTHWASEDYESEISDRLCLSDYGCVSVASVEYKLVMSFGIAFDLFASVFALFVLLGALLRAPEGYEDENAFHIWFASGRRPAIAPQFLSPPACSILALPALEPAPL
jgi:hypothetical protein